MIKRVKDIIQAAALRFGYALIPDPNKTDGLYTQHNEYFKLQERHQAADAAGIEAQAKSGFMFENAWRLHVALWAAATANNIPGAFVECGTWYGRTMRSILEYIPGMAHPVYLIDTFSGFAPDMLTMAERTRPHQYELVRMYSNDPDQWYRDVKDTFKHFSNVTIVSGAVPHILTDEGMPARVSFLHLDMNCAEAEYQASRFFWDRLAPGAIVLLDDYAYANLDEQYHAHERFAREVGIEILSLPTGQGMYIK